MKVTGCADLYLTSGKRDDESPWRATGDQFTNTMPPIKRSSETGNPVATNLWFNFCLFISYSLSTRYYFIYFENFSRYADSYFACFSLSFFWRRKYREIIRWISYIQFEKGLNYIRNFSILTFFCIMKRESKSRYSLAGVREEFFFFKKGIFQGNRIPT